MVNMELKYKASRMQSQQCTRAGVQILRTQDTSDPGHFGPKTLRTQDTSVPDTSALVPKCPDTAALVFEK